jgi:hypothetical protein
MASTDVVNDTIVSSTIMEEKNEVFTSAVSDSGHETMDSKAVFDNKLALKVDL